ncbi:MAG: amidohydrolase family protein [Spirochaetes bacterium]|nr:amidohydrolase family protein [Spirochaetota bacterium]
MKYKVIDVHCHAFPDFLAEKAMSALSEHSGPYKPFTDGKISSLLKSMDKANIQTSFIANIATKPEQAKSILEWSKDIHSDRIIPLGSIHPDSTNWENEIDDIKKAGIPGIKLHSMYQDFEVDEKKMLPIYEYIASKNLFVLFHAGYDIAFPEDKRSTPDKFLNVKRLLPELIMICAHVGGWRQWRESLEYIAGNDIYIETSFNKEVEPNILFEIINKHDIDKILFGTDSPWLDQENEINNIIKLKVTREIRQKIFYDNITQLLNEIDYNFIKN